jgi:hypothetical protein
MRYFLPGEFPGGSPPGELQREPKQIDLRDGMLLRKKERGGEEGRGLQGRNFVSGAS